MLVWIHVIRLYIRLYNVDENLEFVGGFRAHFKVNIFNVIAIVISNAQLFSVVFLTEM